MHGTAGGGSVSAADVSVVSRLNWFRITIQGEESALRWSNLPNSDQLNDPKKNVKCATDPAVTEGLFLIILKYSNTDLRSVCVLCLLHIWHTTCLSSFPLQYHSLCTASNATI